MGDHELTDEVMAALEHGVRIAPAHNIPYIETINVFRRLLPTARMVGAFETDFHRTVPFERQVYSVPYEWYEKYGVRRYGYHGASHGHVAGRVAEPDRSGRARRVISCHLGGSGSLCAILKTAGAWTAPAASPCRAACRTPTAPATSTPTSSPSCSARA